MPTTFDAIFISSSTIDADPNERSPGSENADVIVGYELGAPDQPLFENIVSVTATDNRGADGELDTDRGGRGETRDTVTYDLGDGNGEQTQVFEGVGLYDATLTFFDGSTANVSAVIFQDESGNIFLAPELSSNADSAAFQSGPIVSMKINSLIGSNYNLTADRNGSDFVTCFTAGTWIDTPEGARAVEDLRAGDAVLTVDNGAQILRWVGSRQLDLGMAADNLRPVRIAAGALGQGLPAIDLVVSPQHRILVRSAIAQRMFGTDEVLVAAKQLIALPGIEIDDRAEQVTYVHILFDGHQMVTSNGAISESLFTGPQALKGVSDAARDEILALFPHLSGIGEELEQPDPARPLVGGRKGRKLAERHLVNREPLVAAH